MRILMNDIDFFYINLDYRTDRNEHAIRELSRFGIEAARISGCQEVPPNGIFFGDEWSESNKKCFFAHYDLITRYDGGKILGIFEDDILLCDDFLERFRYIEEMFDQDWDIFFLSAFYHLNSDPSRWHKSGDYEKTHIKYIHRVYGSFCTHSYLVNPRSAEKIARLMREHASNAYAVDNLLVKIQPLLNCYAFTPGMANQMACMSDIIMGPRDHSVFEQICGRHYYQQRLSDFDYDAYFS